MYNKKRILAIIPARGGSKGIKDKNIIDLCGKPLISYTIEAAKKSKYIDDTVVSTDSEKIAAVARECGAEIPFMRPAELASDKAKTIDAILHAVAELRRMDRAYDVLVLLQPTEPLRTNEDIDRAIELYFEKGEKSLVSISQVDDHPLLMRTLNEDRSMKKLLNVSSTCRRQDMDTFYRVNGCIYINPVADLSDETSFNDNEIGFVMEQSHSVDIDELKDLKVAEYYISQKG